MNYSYLDCHQGLECKVANLFGTTDEGGGWYVQPVPEEILWELSLDLSDTGRSAAQRVYDVAFGTRNCVLKSALRQSGEILVSSIPVASSVVRIQASVRWLLDGCEKLPKVRVYASGFTNSPFQKQLLLLHTETELQQQEEVALSSAREISPMEGGIIGLTTGNAESICVVKFLDERFNGRYDAEILVVDQKGLGLTKGSTLFATYRPTESASALSVLELVSLY